MPCASTIAARFSASDARCQSAHAACCCASAELFFTSPMSGGMPSDLAMSAWVVALSAARQSIERAACACTRLAIFACSAPAATTASFACHAMSGGMPPSFAKVTWFADESLRKPAHVRRTRSARSGVRTAEDPSRPTSRLAITPRFSACLAASAVSAPATHSTERSVQPVTSSERRGSMPPSLAIVSLLPW